MRVTLIEIRREVLRSPLGCSGMPSADGDEILCDEVQRYHDATVRRRRRGECNLTEIELELRQGYELSRERVEEEDLVGDGDGSTTHK